MLVLTKKTTSIFLYLCIGEDGISFKDGVFAGTVEAVITSVNCTLSRDLLPELLLADNDAFISMNCTVSKDRRPELTSVATGNEDIPDCDVEFVNLTGSLEACETGL